MTAAMVEVVERVQRGDTDAYGEIYQEYRDTVFRFVYFRVGNRQIAEDITSDTFVRALKGIGGFTWQGRDLGAWLVTIARNLVTDHFKSARYRFEITTGDMLDADRAASSSPESEALDAIHNAQLRDALRYLTDDQRECLTYRYLREMSVAETAAAMNRSDEAVKTLAYRATRALTRFLARVVRR